MLEVLQFYTSSFWVWFGLTFGGFWLLVGLAFVIGSGGRK